MKNREVIFWTIIIALIGGGILYISLNKNQSSIDVKNVDNQSISMSTTTDTPNKTIIKPVTKVINKTTITQSKSVIPTYSLSDLAKHNNQLSCWTIVSGKIYDITSFIYSHPAGVSKILRGCGIDATNLYGRVGAHDISKLSNFVIGTVK